VRREALTAVRCVLCVCVCVCVRARAQAVMSQLFDGLGERGSVLLGKSMPG